MTKFETKEQYEAWVRDSRARGRRERIRRRIAVGLGIVAFLVSLFASVVWVSLSTAAPLQTPPSRERGLKEPDAAPKRGVTLNEAKEACERNGGHWFKEDGGDQMPNHYIVGCLFAVPKSAK